MISETEETTLVPQPQTPLALLQMAIEQKLNPSLISQFMDLQDRTEAKRSMEAYARAMNAAQTDMPIVVRDAVNAETKKRFATLEAVANTMRPVYVRHGFTLEYGEEDSPLEGHRRIVCECQHIDGHSKKFHLDSPIDDTGPKGGATKTKIQGLGSLVTYLRRYLACMIFNVVVADQDTDGNASEPLLNEEQCVILRAKFLDCENAGCKVTEEKFIGWLAAQQRAPATTLEELQQKIFVRAISELDKRLRSAIQGMAPKTSQE